MNVKHQEDSCAFQIVVYRISKTSIQFKQLFCRPYESLITSGYAVDRRNYYIVHSEYQACRETLDEIYERLNREFAKRGVDLRISVSDVILIGADQAVAYYVDSYGFVDVTRTFTQD